MSTDAADLSEPAAPPPAGQVIDDRYLIERKLGQGGMAVVYQVYDRVTDRQLALKRLTGERGSRGRGELRFRREFHTMARLRHPRVVEVYDYAIDDTGPYYTLELLQGRDLYDLRPVSAPRACQLLADIGAALAFLHTRRLLHRDLAPRNVRCTGSGRAKLLDFGVLATVGVSYEVAGTPPFIAPENIWGLPLDHRVDIFGLGALAYFLLTGRHAYPARRVADLEHTWLTRPPHPGDLVEGIPSALDQLVMAMLSLDPLARPGSAAEVIDRLQAIGNLPRDTAPKEVARGYLISTELIGRRSEIQRLRRMIDSARGGEGRAVVIEAPSGAGKSRLLRELALTAQTNGLTVLAASGDAADRGPFGLLRALSRELVNRAATDAMEAARGRAGIIGRVIPELEPQAEISQPAWTYSDLAEERMRLQGELTGWFTDVAQRRPIALLVDDLQRADEASAATIAALSHAATTAPLLVVTTLRTDEPARAPAAVDATRATSHRMRSHRSGCRPRQGARPRPLR